MEISITNKIKKWFVYDQGNNLHKKVIENIRDIVHRLKNLADTNYRLGLHHSRLHNLADATLRFRIVLRLNPNHVGALYNLAKCLFIKNKKEQALKYLNKALEIDPSCQEAQYLLAIIANKSTPKAIPVSVIEEYFDNCASRYDQEFHINNGYLAPSRLITLLCDHLQPRASYSVIDIGCGTGQCGFYFVNKIPTLELYGIDISKQMLEIASRILEKNEPIYKKLIHNDYREFLAQTKIHPDIILAGLCLHYEDALAQNLKKMSAVLNKNGYIAFSVEKSEKQQLDFSLNPTLENFCYSENFVKKEIKKSGLHLVKLTESQIKNDRVAFLCICTKPHS